MRRDIPSALIPRPRVPLNERIAWSIHDAAAAVGVSATLIKEMIRNGRLKPAKLGRRTLLKPSDVEAAIFGK